MNALGSDRKPGKNMSDLALSETFVPDIPKDIIFPEELNAYLRDQIQCLTHENGMLKRNLSECEVKLKSSLTEVQTLSKQVKQFEEAAPGNNFSTISNIASAKIVELSKKLREKCSELEATKTKCSRLEHRIRILEETPKCEATITNSIAEAQKPTNDQAEEIKQLQEKLNATNSKLFEAKNANAQLKNDLKLANKFLQSEIGESFDSLQSLVNSGGAWRGRAQMVCDLQQKNAELKEKIKSLSDKRPKLQEPPQPKPDRRIETLSKENMILKSEIQDLKRKLEASRARLKVFESDNSMLKGKMSVINEQQDNDRNLIATLTGQLSTIRNVQNEEAKKKDQTITKLQKEVKELKAEVSKEKCRAENLMREMEEKIAEMNNAKERNEMSGNRPRSSVSAMGDGRTLARLEAERLRLLELTKIANGRLDAERKSLANLQMQLKTEKQKNAKLESRIARLELDKCDKTTSAYSLTNVRAKDKDPSLLDKLQLAEEQIKNLQTRLDIEQRERQTDFQEFAKIIQNYTLGNEY